jgi:hypothetical protein
MKIESKKFIMGFTQRLFFNPSFLLKFLIQKIKFQKLLGILGSFGEFFGVWDIFKILNFLIFLKFKKMMFEKKNQIKNIFRA